MPYFKIIIEKVKDHYSAYVDEGCQTTINGQGDTPEESVENLIEAYYELVEFYKEDGTPLPNDLQGELGYEVIDKNKS